MSEPSPRRRLLTVLVGAFLIVQVGVPVVALFGPRPARFGWHMYSALPPLPEVSIVHADGTEEPVDLGTFFAVQRAEIDYADAVRRRLCETSDATEILIRTDTAGVESVPCGP
ncbi:MAG TPA: hypothetical protein VFH63_00135 [candidate division Zixibacteria bacterium]|nr:hypothetical protein [candidate division Zixibacteria bacterium]